ncbi:MAG: SAM-dependent chlorinase/fluorinase [Solirubrobacterales bacterium]|nr:SAM-dependent chlorinase/fluorinase [Solirubrobacterales bacterium]
MSAPPWVTFLSDYGLEDEFVGVCHGVIARRCGQARVIDITHAIPRHNVRAGAWALCGALAYMPRGVHLAIVDPEVGTQEVGGRRAVALATADEEQRLVGPDNGLLMAAAELLGGVVEAVDIGRSEERLEPVSATFHGRDIFAPVAAALAAGRPLAALGEPLAVDELHTLSLTSATVRDGALRAHVRHVDRFGNLTLDATHAQLGQLGLRLGQRVAVHGAGATHSARYARTFAEVPAGALLLYEDSRRLAALAVNRGSAAQTLGLERDGELRLRAE